MAAVILPWIYLKLLDEAMSTVITFWQLFLSSYIWCFLLQLSYYHSPVINYGFMDKKKGAFCKIVTNIISSNNDEKNLDQRLFGWCII